MVKSLNFKKRRMANGADYTRKISLVDVPKLKYCTSTKPFSKHCKILQDALSSPSQDHTVKSARRLYILCLFRVISHSLS